MLNIKEIRDIDGDRYVLVDINDINKELKNFHKIGYEEGKREVLNNKLNEQQKEFDYKYSELHKLYIKTIKEYERLHEEYLKIKELYKDLNDYL